MNPKRMAPTSVEAYIAGYPEDVREILARVRSTIRAAVPEAEEKISYQIPTFTLGGRSLVYFAGYKSHIGLYPAPIGDPAFPGDLSKYASGRGTVRFALDEQIPYDVITDIVTYLKKKTLTRAESA